MARGEGTAYIAHVVPGLEEFAERDLRTHLGDIEMERVLRRFDERTSLLLFRFRGASRILLTQRSIEDVFALAAASPGVPPDRKGLAAIRAAITGSPVLSSALTAASPLRVRKARRVTYRVVARVAGKYSYRRVDVQRAVERALGETFPTWRLVEDDAQFEFWVHLVGGDLIVGLRLSDITMRQRIGERVTLPASLKPTVAYAMVSLSRPVPEDVFLDPMCGSGTIVIERGEVGRYRLLLGGDVDPAAVDVTRRNIGPRFKPIEIRQWDARRLPLDAGSISAVVCNLPFGKQIGTPGEIRALYPALLTEWRRVLDAAGRAVLLAGDRAAMAWAVGQGGWAMERRLPVMVRGFPATIYQLRPV